MKKVFLFGVFAFLTIPFNTFADQCPSPDTMKIEKHGDELVVTGIPKGYTLDLTALLSLSQPITFDYVQMSTSSTDIMKPTGPYFNRIAASNIRCFYSTRIDEGRWMKDYNGIHLSKNDSVNKHYNLASDWFVYNGNVGGGGLLACENDCGFYTSPTN